MTQQKLKRTLAFTDIHWGKSNNSDIHNQDCAKFIDWVIGIVKSDPTIDSIAFLGDWFDNRAAINVKTLNASHKAAKALSELGLPIYFIIGNHDLYHRHTREVYSVISFHDLPNFRVINEPVVIEDFVKPALFCPYLFHNEYPSLGQYLDVNTWWGHFEFRGFIVTGYNLVMHSGPDHSLYDGPSRIFSGHFHKRQTQGNVTYIGNCFPHSFADADDVKRGVMIYDHSTDDMSFIDWEDCPKFQKVKLSVLVGEDTELYSGARVRCITDEVITYEESIVLRQMFVDRFNLREFVFEETADLEEALIGNNVDNIDTDDDDSEKDENNETVEEMVVSMLQTIDTSQIINQKLVDIFINLR